MKHLRWILLPALLAGLLSPAQTERETQDRRLSEIRAKRTRAEQLTAEELEFLKTVQARRAAEFAQGNPPRESTGLIPLTDLSTGAHKGEQGGLYRGGANQAPPAHMKSGVEIAGRIAPLDPQGRKSEEGKIVLVSIGMSNTTQEFQVFQKLAAHDSEVSKKILLVDGAQGGQAADTTANPQAKFWQVVEQRLGTAGATDKQVQVVWLKQAIIAPSQPFPAEARRLSGYLVETLHNLAGRFPNLKIAYLSSRIYGGYALTPLNPEPFAYEDAFAIKWLIADQISEKPELNYHPARGPVRSPWLAWGPYLWADGIKGRKDGLVYLREDLEARDGTHPSMAGREKVAKLLLDFLKTHPTARPWFVHGPAS